MNNLVMLLCLFKCAVCADIGNSMMLVNDQVIDLKESPPHYTGSYTFFDGELANFTCVRDNKMYVIHTIVSQEYKGSFYYIEGVDNNISSLYITLKKINFPYFIDCEMTDYRSKSKITIRIKLTWTTGTRKEKGTNFDYIVTITVLILLVIVLGVVVVILVYRLTKIQKMQLEARVVDDQRRSTASQNQYEIIDYNRVTIRRCGVDISERPAYPLPPETLQENHYHYNTVYDHKQRPDQLKSKDLFL